MSDMQIPASGSYNDPGLPENTVPSNSEHGEEFDSAMESEAPAEAEGWSHGTGAYADNGGQSYEDSTHAAEEDGLLAEVTELKYAKSYNDATIEKLRNIGAFDDGTVSFEEFEQALGGPLTAAQITSAFRTPEDGSKTPNDTKFMFAEFDARSPAFSALSPEIQDILIANGYGPESDQEHKITVEALFDAIDQSSFGNGDNKVSSDEYALAFKIKSPVLDISLPAGSDEADAERYRQHQYHFNQLPQEVKDYLTSSGDTRFTQSDLVAAYRDMGESNEDAQDLAKQTLPNKANATLDDVASIHEQLGHYDDNVITETESNIAQTQYYYQLYYKDEIIDALREQGAFDDRQVTFEELVRGIEAGLQEIDPNLVVKDGELSEEEIANAMSEDALDYIPVYLDLSQSRGQFVYSTFSDALQDALDRIGALKDNKISGEELFFARANITNENISEAAFNAYKEGAREFDGMQLSDKISVEEYELGRRSLVEFYADKMDPKTLQTLIQNGALSETDNYLTPLEKEHAELLSPTTFDKQGLAETKGYLDDGLLTFKERVSLYTDNDNVTENDGLTFEQMEEAFKSGTDNYFSEYNLKTTVGREAFEQTWDLEATLVDADGDDVITKQELFNALNTNGDNIVSVKEFEAGRINLSELPKEELVELLAQTLHIPEGYEVEDIVDILTDPSNDALGDNYISRMELGAALSFFPEDLWSEETVEALYQNGAFQDNQVTFAELAKALNQLTDKGEKDLTPGGQVLSDVDAYGNQLEADDPQLLKYEAFLKQVDENHPGENPPRSEQIRTKQSELRVLADQYHDISRQLDNDDLEPDQRTALAQQQSGLRKDIEELDLEIQGLSITSDSDQIAYNEKVIDQKVKERSSLYSVDFNLSNDPEQDRVSKENEEERERLSKEIEELEAINRDLAGIDQQDLINGGYNFNGDNVVIFRRVPESLGTDTNPATTLSFTIEGDKTVTDDDFKSDRVDFWQDEAYTDLGPEVLAELLTSNYHSDGYFSAREIAVAKESVEAKKSLADFKPEYHEALKKMQAEDSEGGSIITLDELFEVISGGDGTVSIEDINNAFVDDSNHFLKEMNISTPEGGLAFANLNPEIRERLLEVIGEDTENPEGAALGQPVFVYPDDTVVQTISDPRGNGEYIHIQDFTGKFTVADATFTDLPADYQDKLIQNKIDEDHQRQKDEWLEERSRTLGVPIEDLKSLTNDDNGLRDLAIKNKSESLGVPASELTMPPLTDPDPETMSFDQDDLREAASKHKIITQEELFEAITGNPGATTLNKEEFKSAFFVEKDYKNIPDDVYYTLDAAGQDGEGKVSVFSKGYVTAEELIAAFTNPIEAPEDYRKDPVNAYRYLPDDVYAKLETSGAFDDRYVSQEELDKAYADAKADKKAQADEKA